MARLGVQNKIFRGMGRHIRFRNILPELKNTHIDTERNLMKSIKMDIKSRVAKDKKIKERKRGIP